MTADELRKWAISVCKGDVAAAAVLLAELACEVRDMTTASHYRRALVTTGPTKTQPKELT